MNKLCTAIVVCSLFCFVSAQNTDPPKENNTQPSEVKKESPFTLHADIEIQAQKAFWSNGSSDNLDQLFGRVNFGASLKTELFSSAFSIRAYPEGFGYEALTGIEFDDWFWTLEQEKTSIAKFQISEAWAMVTYPFLGIKVGRFYTNLTQTNYFGNYLDVEITGSFLQKEAYHNALEFTNVSGPLSSSIMLGVGDKNLNRGYLRVLEQIKPVENFIFSLGYRGNIFDRARYNDADIGNRFFTGLSYEIIKGFKPYVEFSVLDELMDFEKLSTTELYEKWNDLFDNGQTELWFDQWLEEYKAIHYVKKYKQEVMPILIGLTIPTANVLDLLAVEVEIVPDRQVNGEDKKIEVALSIEKKIGKRAKFNVAVYSDPTSDSMKDIGMGIRFTSLLH